MQAVQGSGRGRGPAAQRRVLCRLLRPPRPRAGEARHQVPRHVRPRGPRAGLRVRWQGLAGTVEHPARPRIPRVRAVPRPGDRRVLGTVGPRDAGIRGPAGRRTDRGRPPRRIRLRHPHRRQEGVAVELRRVRVVQALRVQPRGPGPRVRCRGHGPQPRRRSGDAVGEHAAVADRLHRPPAPGAPGARRDGQEGEAASPAVRAGDRRLRVHPGHRLRGRGVSARGRQHPAPVQGSDERTGSPLARDQGPVLPGLRGEGGVRVRGRGPAGRGAHAVRAVRPADDGPVLRLLPGPGSGPGRAPGPGCR